MLDHYRRKGKPEFCKDFQDFLPSSICSLSTCGLFSVWQQLHSPSSELEQLLLQFTTKAFNGKNTARLLSWSGDKRRNVFFTVTEEKNSPQKKHLQSKKWLSLASLTVFLLWRKKTLASMKSDGGCNYFFPLFSIVQQHDFGWLGCKPTHLLRCCCISDK